MPQPLAPVLKHRTWRHLLRDFSSAHPQLLHVPNSKLMMYLTPAASVAWWLSKHASALLETEQELHLLLPGVDFFECQDSGRWFGFLPWLLGRPDVRVRVTLIGNQLSAAEDDCALSLDMSAAQLEQEWSTPYASLVAKFSKQDIFNGTLGQWRRSVDPQPPVDGCVLFAPNLSKYCREWLTEDDLLPLIHQQLPIGVFSHSTLDALADQHALQLLDVPVTPQEGEENPWYLEHEMADVMGAMARVYWPLRVQPNAKALDFEVEAFKDFEALLEHGLNENGSLGADSALVLGTQVEVMRVDGGQKDSIILLPFECAILESTGKVGFFDDAAFVPLDELPSVPGEYLTSRPSDDLPIERILWALRLHRDWLVPLVEAAEADKRKDVAIASGLTDIGLANSAPPGMPGLPGEDRARPRPSSSVLQGNPTPEVTPPQLKFWRKGVVKR